MELLREELPDAAVVSIGHRPGLELHHDRVLVLEASPEGAVLAAPDEPGDEHARRTGPPPGRKRSRVRIFSAPLRAVSRLFG